MTTMPRTYEEKPLPGRAIPKRREAAPAASRTAVPRAVEALNGTWPRAITTTAAMRAAAATPPTTVRTATTGGRARRRAGDGPGWGGLLAGRVGGGGPRKLGRVARRVKRG